MRRLVETTLFTYAEISGRTGVAPASICRWTAAGKWARPAFAPRATDTVPRWRASAKLKRRTLAARLHALAERAIRELEAAPRVDLAQLREALEILKLTMLAERPRKRWRILIEKAASPTLTEEARARVIADLRSKRRSRKLRRPVPPSSESSAESIDGPGHQLSAADELAVLSPGSRSLTPGGYHGQFRGRHNQFRRSSIDHYRERMAAFVLRNFARCRGTQRLLSLCEAPRSKNMV